MSFEGFSNLTTELPNLDIVDEILTRFISDPQSPLRGAMGIAKARPLIGGLSGSVVLELTLQDYSLYIFKVTLTPYANDEIKKTQKVQELTRNVAFGSAQIRSYSSDDGRWTGFTLYHAGDFAGGSTSPIESDICQWDNEATASLLDNVFGLLNRRLYGQQWEVVDSATHFQYFAPKLFPFAVAVDGVLHESHRPPYTGRINFWKAVKDRDAAGKTEPFHFLLRQFRVIAISRDGRTVLCRHQTDEIDAALTLELQLKEPLAAHELDNTLGREFYVEGRLSATRSEKYKSIFLKYIPAHLIPALPLKPAPQKMCRGGIHGDLHENNILMVRSPAGEVITPAFIDFAKMDVAGALWWDYVKMELSLRKLFLRDHPEQAHILAALDVVLNLETLSWVWHDQRNADVVRMWDSEFPSAPALPLPFLRLRWNAFELFKTKLPEEDYQFWAEDYLTCLFYGSLVFLKYDIGPAFEHYYASLASRIQQCMAEGVSSVFKLLPVTLRLSLAIKEVEEFTALPSVKNPASFRSAAAALNAIYTSDESVLASILAKEEPPLATVYAPPDLTLLTPGDVDSVLAARAKMRREVNALVRYREVSRTALRQVEQEFAYLRGRYEIPLKARVDVSTTAAHDVLLLVHSLPYCVVLGGPGSGKTTLAQFLRFADSGEGDRLPVPIILSFSEWNTHSVASDAKAHARSPDSRVEALNDSFIHLLAERLSSGEDTELLQQLLESGCFLLIVDGLNEIPQEDRGAFVLALTSIREQFVGNRFIVSSRTIHYKNDFAGWPTITLEELTEDEAKSYIRRRLRSDPAGNGDKTPSPERLIEKLFGTGTPRSVRELARTPMFLTFLLKYYATEGTLPNSRGKLFRHIGDDLLKRGNGAGMPLSLKQAALSELAFTMLNMEHKAVANLKARSLIVIERQDAIAILDDALAINPAVRSVLQPLKHPRIGEMIYQELIDSEVLQGHNEGASASFHHQAFLEFYASLKLIETLKTKPEEFLEKLEQRVWHETIHTLVGYDSDDSRGVIQIFLRHTPDIHFGLMTECLTNAEYVDTAVREAVIERLKQIIWDKDETDERRAGAVRSLASLARLAWDEFDIFGILLNHLGQLTDACPAVIPILLEHLDLLTAEQRLEYFDYLHKFITENVEDLRQPSLDALSQNDTALSGATTASILLVPANTSADSLQKLLAGLGNRKRLPAKVLTAIPGKREPSVMAELIRVLGGYGKSRDAETFYEELLRAVENAEDLPEELIEALKDIPQGFVEKEHERWRNLALRKVGEEMRNPKRGAMAVWLSIVAKCGEVQATPQTGQDILVPSLAFTLDQDVLIPTEISVEKVGEVIEALKVVKLPDGPREMILVSIIKMFHVLSLFSAPDKGRVADVLNLILLQPDEVLGALLPQLIETCAQEPLWVDFSSQLATLKAHPNLDLSPLLWELLNDVPLTNKELTEGLENLSSKEKLKRGRALLMLCRPVGAEGLSRLARALDVEDETRGVLVLFLLGLHSSKLPLTEGDAEFVYEQISSLRSDSPAAPGFSDHFTTLPKRRLIRQGFALLSQAKLIPKEPERRIQIFRAALSCMGAGAPWFNNFIIDEICNRELDLLERMAKSDSEYDAQLLCRFLTRVDLSFGHETLTRLLRKSILRWIRNPGKLERRFWSEVVQAIGKLKMTEAEDALIAVVENYKKWRKYIEAGDLEAIIERGDSFSNAFHEIVEVLQELGSKRVHELVFARFGELDTEGKRRSVEFLKKIGWPDGAKRKEQMGEFLARKIDEIVALDNGRETFERLVDALRDSRDVALSVGRALRATASDKSRGRFARNTADRAVTILEANNGILVPYKLGLFQRLPMLLRRGAGNE